MKSGLVLLGSLSIFLSIVLFALALILAILAFIRSRAAKQQFAPAQPVAPPAAAPPPPAPRPRPAARPTPPPAQAAQADQAKRPTAPEAQVAPPAKPPAPSVASAAAAAAPPPRAPLPTPPPAADATMVVPITHGTLVCVAGPFSGLTFTIPRDGAWLGREASLAQFVIPDTAVSKKHVWIGARDGVVVAVDENSTNGTFLNSSNNPRVRTTPLQPGDKLIIVSESIAVLEFRIDG